jgi:hypothetical protein
MTKHTTKTAAVALGAMLFDDLVRSDRGRAREAGVLAVLQGYCL